MPFSSKVFGSELRLESVMRFVLIGVIFWSIGGNSGPLHGSTEWIGYTQTGKASFYSMKFQSQKTASGERFNQLSKTAAHKKLPLGTRVKVTNLENDKAVIVTINDRGPFVEYRIIDLSIAAFGEIAKVRSGVIPVRIEVVK